ncbi:MAG TPA: MaoC family dehydratase [Candidatus Limnocylindria bacterium]|nr:MaoC family dehydratase [Candidatus Limnocylindria bacterium]
MTRYLEDFRAGDTYVSPRVTVSAEDIVRFAREFDPQPFHLDPSAAATSFFGTLVASGWHTAALTMRLLVTCGADPAWGYIGASIEEMRWPRPVMPGDALYVRFEVLDVTASRSKPDRGFVRGRVETLRSEDEPVQQLVVNMLVPVRPAARTDSRPDAP